MTVHATMTRHRPSVPDETTANDDGVSPPPRIDDDGGDDSSVAPSGGPMILANKKSPCSSPSIVLDGPLELVGQGI